MSVKIIYGDICGIQTFITDLVCNPKETMSFPHWLKCDY